MKISDSTKKKIAERNSAQKRALNTNNDNDWNEYKKLTSAKFGAFFAPFEPLGAIFGVEVRFKNIFGTYLHRLTTFILEV